MYAKHSGITNSNIYRINYKLYTATGFGPARSKNKLKKYLYKLYGHFVYINFTFVFLAYVIDIYLVRGDLQKLNLNLCNSVICLGSLMKTKIMSWQLLEVDKIQNDFDHFLNVPNIGKRRKDVEIVNRRTLEFVKITKTLDIWLVAVIVVWITSPILDSRIGRFVGPFPFYTGDKSPIYEMIYIYTSVILIIWGSHIKFFDLIIYGFFNRIVTHFEIIEKDIVDFGHFFLDIKKGKNTFETIFKDIIIHHQQTLMQLKRVQDVYVLPLLIQLVVGSLLITVVVFDIVSNDQASNVFVVKQILFVTMECYSIYLYCYFGSQIEEKSHNLARALYMSPWYEMNIKLRKLYLFMIREGQNAPIVKGGRMLPINLKTFQKILEISYSLIGLLRKINNKSSKTQA